MSLLFNFTFSECSICETDLPSQTAESKHCPPANQSHWPSSLPPALRTKDGGRGECLMLKESWPVTRSLSPLSVKFGILISFLIRRGGNVSGRPRKRLIGKKLSPALHGLVFCVLLNCLVKSW